MKLDQQQRPGLAYSFGAAVGGYITAVKSAIKNLNYLENERESFESGKADSDVFLKAFNENISLSLNQQHLMTALLDPDLENEDRDAIEEFFKKYDEVVGELPPSHENSYSAYFRNMTKLAAKIKDEGFFNEPVKVEFANPAIVS